MLSMSRIVRKIVVLLALLVTFQGREVIAQDITRKDFSVESEPGISLFVREVRGPTSRGDGEPPILLLHGARVPGVASFDLQVPNGSLAADLAKAGYPVYIMDARGYGYSTRLPEMSDPPMRTLRWFVRRTWCTILPPWWTGFERAGR